MQVTDPLLVSNYDPLDYIEQDLKNGSDVHISPGSETAVALLALLAQRKAVSSHA